MSSFVISQWMQYLSAAIDGIAAVVIGLASLEAAISAANLLVRRISAAASKEEIRLRLGMWLSLALEFEIAADILRTTIAPSWDVIGKLAAIVVLRTVLNYFLQTEINRAALRDQNAAASVAGGSGGDSKTANAGSSMKV